MLNAVVLEIPQSNYISVKYWLERNAVSIVATSDISNIPYDILIVPGVGSFDNAMEYLETSGLKDTIDSAYEDGKLVIGICLGMQLFCVQSEEGTRKGLGYVPFLVRRLPCGVSKTPNIGWRATKSRSLDGSLNGLDIAQFFFMHGYGVLYDDLGTDSQQMEILTSDCNGEIVAAFKFKNLLGIQFHPEKSYRGGDQILQTVIAQYVAQRS